MRKITPNTKWSILAPNEKLSINKLLKLSSGDVFHYGEVYLHNPIVRGRVKYVCIRTKGAQWTIISGSADLGFNQILNTGKRIPFISTLKKMLKLDWEAEQLYVK